MVNSTKQKPNSKSNKTLSTSSSAKVPLIAGAATLIIAGAGGGYAYRAATEPKTNDSNTAVVVELPEHDYKITRYRLTKTRQQLANLTVRSDNEDIPDYNSNGVVSSDWNDADGNGCQTRYDILFASLANFDGNSETCKVENGILLDLYTGQIIQYDSSVSGGGIDIDHVVAKKNAWKSGGYLWDAEKWAEYVNDEDILLPVSASANRSKGDKDANAWLVPNNPDYVCQYVVRQIQIKTEYELSVSEDEKMVMEDVLKNQCEVK